jgi:subtilisin family serine protease
VTSRKLRRARRPGRNQSHSKHQRRLRLEALEDRRLLTTMSEFDLFDASPEGESDAPAYMPGQLFMRFTDTTSGTEREEILEEQGYSILKTYNTVDAILVKMPEWVADPVEGVAYWSDHPNVVYAEPDYIAYLTALPNDPRFGEMYGLNNTGQTGGQVDADIDAPEAWDLFTGSSETIVAINDTGIDYNHEDLADNMWTNPGEIPADGIDNDGNGYIDDVHGWDAVNGDGDPMDGHSHGTHVAGTVGAKGDNSIGVTGINWDVSLMAVKVCTDGGACPQSAQIEGLDYITTMKSQFDTNIVASNHSYGGYGFSQAIFDAIDAHIDADVLFVAAAGNDSNNNDVLPAYPASYDLDGIIAVAASEDNDDMSWFSNYGLVNVDLAAPGGALQGAAQRDILSTVPGDAYDFFAGTSMASPHVAGVAGLLRGMVPELNVYQARQLILGGVDPIPALNGQVATGGRLNAFNTLSMVETFQIQGLVWADTDADGKVDDTEGGIANWTVFIDYNDDGLLDTNEPFAITDAEGLYAIESYGGPGDYTVAQIVQPKWTQTYPTSGAHTVTIVDGDDIVTDINFGNLPVPGDVSGVKWHDLDGDGVRDPDEPGMPGVYIYADVDRSGTLALGEPAAVTDLDGYYVLNNVPAGNTLIREVLNPGWLITYPDGGYHELFVEPDSITPNVDFGNASNVDFGDAPAPYATLAEHGGASHGILAGFYLGEMVDAEADGIPHDDGTGDDLQNMADEDGVSFPSALFAGFSGSVDVTVHTGAYPAGVLHAWIDFNADGDFEDSGEQVVADTVLDDGVHRLTFDVPLGAHVGNTFARFRYGYEYGLGPNGAATAGEVEDHMLLVLEDKPNAVNDRYEIAQDSSDVPLPVLENDFPSTTGSLAIVEVTQPHRATVEIAADGQSLLITPDRAAFSPPNETFTYTIDDGTGKRSTADVTVFIRPDIVQAVAIDDVYYVTGAQVGNEFDVMVNDLPGASGIISLIDVANPAHGTAVIDDKGTPGDATDDVVRYTPGATFENMDQFTYTIANLDGEASATITVFETPDPGNQDVEIALSIEDIAGIPVDEITEGDQFVLVATVQDLRPFQPVAGVFAAYLDILYDRDVVLPNLDGNNNLGFDITFGADYGNGPSGTAFLPGIIDEVGTFETADGPLGDGPLELFRIAFTANEVGEATFAGDPADASPTHDVLLFEPPAPVSPADIRYGFTSVSVIADGVASGASDPYDVNLDGHVTALDALRVINRLNVAGPHSVYDRSSLRHDVNRDAFVAPIDALLIINRLNFGLDGEGEGESQFQTEPEPTVELPVTMTDTTASLVDSDEIDEPVAPLATDDGAWRLLVGEDGSSASPLQDISPDDDQWESLLKNLAEDVLEAWLDPEED